MKASTIHWLDKNLGRPLCFFLTIHRKVRDFLKNSGEEGAAVSKILFLKLVEQGSTVLAYPALKKAADKVGKENVYFLVFKENRFILEVLDIIPRSNIVEVDSENLWKFTYSVVKAGHKIRKEKIDAVLDMEFFSRASAILAYFSGASKRVGLHLFTSEGPYRGDLLNYKLLYNPYLHTSQFFLSLVKALDHSPSKKCALIFNTPDKVNNLPGFSPSVDEEQSLIRKIERLKEGRLTNPMVILNPNASDLVPVRRWPEENFVRLGKMILEAYPGSTLLVTGGPEEKEKGDMIASQIGNAFSLSGRTSFRELLALYCLSDVLVTNDSGPAQFSSLTSIKSIVLFGPETPFLYEPLGNNINVIAPSLICSPCVNVFNHRKCPCEDAECMKSITPEEVFNMVKNLLTPEPYNDQTANKGGN